MRTLSGSSPRGYFERRRDRDRGGGGHLLAPAAAGVQASARRGVSAGVFGDRGAQLGDRVGIGVSSSMRHARASATSMSPTAAREGPRHRAEPEAACEGARHQRSPRPLAKEGDISGARGRLRRSATSAEPEAACERGRHQRSPAAACEGARHQRRTRPMVIAVRGKLLRDADEAGVHEHRRREHGARARVRRCRPRSPQSRCRRHAPRARTP